MSPDEPPPSTQIQPPTPSSQQLPTADHARKHTVDGQDGDGIVRRDFATTSDGAAKPEDNLYPNQKENAPSRSLPHASTNVSSLSESFSESRSQAESPNSSASGSPNAQKSIGLPELPRVPVGATSVPQTPKTAGTKRTASGAFKVGSSSLPNSPTEQETLKATESLSAVSSTPVNTDRIQDVCHTPLCFFHSDTS
jgi:hypothetical protein